MLPSAQAASMARVWLYLVQATNLALAMLQQAVAMRQTCNLHKNVHHAKPKNHNSTAILAAVPTKDRCIPAMDQGIPAMDQGISIKDPGSTTEVEGSCTEDQGIPTEAQRIPSEGPGVLMSQLAPAAVDCVLPATADDSSVSAGVEAHQVGMSPSSAGQGIVDWLVFEPLTDNLRWLPFDPQRSPSLAAFLTPQISLLGCVLNPTGPCVWLPSEPHQIPCLPAFNPHKSLFLAASADSPCLLHA